MASAALLVSALLVLAIGTEADAAPSANGRIAYQGSGGPPSIWVVNPDGSGDRYLVEGDQPSWSPDGSRLAYAAPDRTYDRILAVVDADGSGRRQLSPVTPGYSPDWSPDGERIAFARAGDLYSIGIDGAGLRQLTAGAPNDDRPSWSPDGRAIAFDRQGALWVMEADGTGQRPLDLEGTGPRFSPDGRLLAFQSADAVYVVDADGSGGLRRLTPEGQLSRAPAWSPDGSQLAFATGQGICSVHMSDGVARRVTYRTPSPSLDWQPRSAPLGDGSPYSCFSPRWDLGLTITSTRARARIGSYVQFRVVVRNGGPDPATATETGFGIWWPGEAGFSAISGPCEPVAGDRPTFAHCVPEIVYPGMSAVVTVSLRMHGPGPQRVFTEMDEFSEPHDTNAANDRDSATVLVGGCTIMGTTGADVLRGTPKRDVICGLDGRDVIRGLGGDDEIWSGDRDDVVDGGAGDDRIVGGDGADDLDGADGRDVVWGGLGSDRLYGGQGDDALSGLDGLDRDVFDPALVPDADVVDGGPGSDLVEGNSGEDALRGGRGDDVVLARDGARDRVDCGEGRDRVTADRVDRQRRCERVSRR
jgi:Ca2+-binding RTX toxin-like protein